jgi:Zn-dependent peptidase ImmA (M78 family)
MGKVEARINTVILKECRTHMALSLEDAKKKVKAIEEIEQGDKIPTYKQLADLSDLYEVPDWVFISDELPQEFQLKQSPFFRTIANQQGAESYKIRRLMSKVTKFREFFLDMRAEQEIPIPKFKPPEKIEDTKIMAEKIREWLDWGDQPISFEEIRGKIENKGVLVFLTAKHISKFKFDIKEFRGLAIYNKHLPWIIINDSDALKAQSFTLCHELGHLISQDSILDIQNTENQKEKWCDDLAGNILMPEEFFLKEASSYNLEYLEQIKKLAKYFQVSAFSCLVRLRKLKKISQASYQNFENTLDAENEKIKESFKDFGPKRYRSKEVLRQFGKTYVRTFWQAYSDEVITLHKLGKLLTLKNTKDILNLGELL